MADEMELTPEEALRFAAFAEITRGITVTNPVTPATVLRVLEGCSVLTGVPVNTLLQMQSDSLSAVIQAALDHMQTRVNAALRAQEMKDLDLPADDLLRGALDED